MADPGGFSNMTKADISKADETSHIPTWEFGSLSIGHGVRRFHRRRFHNGSHKVRSSRKVA